MQQDKFSKNIHNIKAKIDSIREMNPTLRGSVEDIEEFKKKLSKNYMPIELPPISENRTSHPQAKPITPVRSTKKVFTMDTVYMKDLHQRYERSPLANIDAPRNEVVSVDKMKETEVINEVKNGQGRVETERFPSNANQPANWLKLQPVIQEGTISEPHKESQATNPVQQSLVAEIREAEQPQAKSPVREVKDSLQKEGNHFTEASKQEQSKILLKPSAEAPKFNFFSNLPAASQFTKAPDTANQSSFFSNTDKKIDEKGHIFSFQKPQPANLCQVNEDISKQPQNESKPPNATFLKTPQQGFNFSNQNEPSSKLLALSFTRPNAQKTIFPSTQAPETKQKSYTAEASNLFDKVPEQRPQVTQPQQKKARLLQGLLKDSQQTTPTNLPLNANETQKPKTTIFGNIQKPSQPSLFAANTLASSPTNSGLSFLVAPQPAGLFSSKSNEKPAVESKPPTFTPSFAPAKIDPVSTSDNKSQGLFQNKGIFGALPSTTTPQGGLFSNADASNPLKEQPKPISSQNSQRSLFQNKEPAASISQQPKKAPEGEEKKDKPNTYIAIGPGGKKLEMPNFLTGDPKKTNLFGSLSNPNDVRNVFSQPSAPLNFFSNPSSNNLFQANTGTPFAFSQPPSQGQENIFNRPVNLSVSNLFNPNQPTNTIGPGQSQLLNKAGESEEELGDEGDEDASVEGEVEADPSLSTGKFDYVKTQVHFKESAVKFREGTVKDNVIENITVSIQSFENSQDRYLHIRLANKCIAFTGMFIKDKTVSRAINNSDKNVEVNFILKIKDSVPAGFALLRIQFKEESVGTKFLKEANAHSSTT